MKKVLIGLAIAGMIPMSAPIAIALAPTANADPLSKPLRRGCRWRNEFM
jgi:hypothetical protein